MTLKEIDAQYCFHDSLLEKVMIDNEAKKAVIDVDFCYWAQIGYDPSDAETGIIHINLELSNTYSGPCGYFDSLSILRTYTKDDSSWVILALDDITETIYEFCFSVRSVSISFD